MKGISAFFLGSFLAVVLGGSSMAEAGKQLTLFDMIPSKKSKKQDEQPLKWLGVLTNFTFDDQGISVSLDTNNKEASNRSWVHLVGKHIALEVTKDRVCQGNYDLTTQQAFPCTDHKIIDSKYVTCFRCRDLCAFNPSFYNVPRTSLSEKQLRYNQDPHYVYLAAFSPDQIKVGIAHSKRLLQRLTEQGARVACILTYVPDAYQARALEEYVIAYHGMAESITALQKLHGYSEDKDLVERLQSRLTQVRDQIYAANANVGKEYGDGSAAVLDLTQFYFPIKANSPLKPSKVLKSIETIQGKVCGAVGSILFIESDDGTIVRFSIQNKLGQLKVALLDEHLKK